MIAALSALVLVLYLSADWVLLGLAIVFLVALAWSAKYAIPALMEHGKLMLNLGSVREGERLVYKGIPWRVESLNIFSDLHNPELENGTVRLPMKDFVDMRSRPAGKGEPWFPSQRGDWVILDGGVYGKVERQTPDMVVLEMVRGTRKTYSPQDYLGAHPQNLSINTFRVRRTVHVHLDHRHEVNESICPTLREELRRRMPEKPCGEQLQRVIVHLMEIDRSSLDLNVVAVYGGEAASEYVELGWYLQEAILDVFNLRGWKLARLQIEPYRAVSANAAETI